MASTNLARRRDVLDLVEEDFGGRARLRELIAHDPQAASDDPSDKFALFFRVLADPATQDVPFSDLCRQYRIKLSEVLDAVKRGVFVRPYLKALQKAADQYVPLVEDMLMRTLPFDLQCETCKGTGLSRVPTTPDESVPTCAICRGVGTITHQPDFDRQKHALEMNPLLPKKGPGILVDNRSVTLPGSTDGHFTPHDFSKLMAATDQVLFKRRAVVPTAVPAAPEAEPADVVEAEPLEPSFDRPPGPE